MTPLNIESRLTLSYYRELAQINAEHEISLVQHQSTSKIYIKKIMNIYDINVYNYLREHPVKHLPHIYELIEDESTLTVIEEYISGSTLQELLEQQNRLTESCVIDYISQLCEILSDLHHCTPPIIHRDIKPSNIIVNSVGVIYLLDLNAAKYESFKSEDTVLIGTKGYAAPEQYGFGFSNPQTDIYAVGILMNTLLSGFSSESPAGLSVYSGFLLPVINRCTQLKPSDRFASALQLKQTLTSYELNHAHYFEINHSGWNNQDNLNNSNSGIQSFLPPGFQTHNVLHMIGASIGYLMLFWCCLNLEVKDAAPTQLIIERVICLLMMFSLVLASCNYRNVQKYFPLCKHPNRFWHHTGIVLMDFLVVTLFMLLLSIFQSIFP